MGAPDLCIIEGSEGTAIRFDLPADPRLHLWIVDLKQAAFVLSSHPGRASWWANQFAVTAAPIDLMPSAGPATDQRTTHRLGFAPLTQRYEWGTADPPAVSVAALASFDFTSADDVMTGHIARALAGAAAAGILPVGGRGVRMAWHAAVGTLAFALHQGRNDQQELPAWT